MMQTQKRKWAAKTPKIHINKQSTKWRVQNLTETKWMNKQATENKTRNKKREFNSSKLEHKT